MIVGGQCPDLVVVGKMIPASTLQVARALAQRDLGSNLNIIIVRHVTQTLHLIVR